MSAKLCLTYIFGKTHYEHKIFHDDYDAFLKDNNNRFLSWVSVEDFPPFKAHFKEEPGLTAAQEWHKACQCGVGRVIICKTHYRIY